MPAPDPIRGRPLLAAMGVLAWAGLLLQLWLSVGLAQANGMSVIDGVIIYLGYFTVLSNLLVALVATLPLLSGNSRAGRWFALPGVRGCATTAIVCVGIGYHLLLRNIWDPQGLQLIADVMLHYVVPVTALAHWAGFPPRTRLAWLAPVTWCTYPIGYGIYALLRGKVLDTYPYPFLDVTALGYGKVLGNTVGLLACFVLVGGALVARSRLDKRLHRADEATPGD